MNTLYIFLDESGDCNFSKNGTAYFTFTSLSLRRPFTGINQLVDLKYDQWERGHDLEYFHAAEDKQIVRDHVFRLIKETLINCQVDCHIVEKRKVNPALQQDHGKFYYTILNDLLRFVLQMNIEGISHLCVILDHIPVKRQLHEIEKAVKKTLARWSDDTGIRYSVLFHQSKSDLNLQIETISTGRFLGSGSGMIYEVMNLYRSSFRVSLRHTKKLPQCIIKKATALTILSEKPPGLLLSGRNL